MSLWFRGRLTNSDRGYDYEKDIDDVQQHQDETDPWLPRPDGHKGRQGRFEQETREGKKETDGVTRGRAKGHEDPPRERGGAA